MRCTLPPGARGALCCLFLAVSLFAQTPESVPDRVIDEKEAAREKQGSVSRSILTVPAYPLKAMRGGMRWWMNWMENSGMFGSFTSPGGEEPAERRQGFRPLLGGFDPGGSVAAGVTYYRNITPGLRFELPVRVSTNLYHAAGANLVVRPESAFSVRFGGNYRAETANDFFGLGPDSSALNRTNYDLRQRSLYVQPIWKLHPNLRAVFEARYTSASIFEGKDQNHPGTRERFGTTGIPGLFGAKLLVAGAALEHDTRDEEGMPSRGGLEHAGLSLNEGLGSADIGYWKYRVDLMRYLPLASKRRVLALRLLGETNQPRGGSQVPFFDLGILGGAPTARGFREFRFYDRSLLLVTAEYRFNLTDWSAAFLFVDEGQVARHPGDFGWSQFRTSWGGGLRFFSSKMAVLSLAIGRSREGTRLYFMLSPRF